MRHARILLCLVIALLAGRAHAILDEVAWEATRIVRVDYRSFETRVHHTRLKERIGAVVQGVELDLVLRYYRHLMWQMTPLFAMAGETDIADIDTPANVRIVARSSFLRAASAWSINSAILSRTGRWV